MDAPYIGIPPAQTRPTPAPAPNPSPSGYAGSIGGPATATVGAVSGITQPPLPGGVGTVGGLQPARRGPTTVDDLSTYVPGEYANRHDGTYLQDANGNFLEGDADAYVRDKLGQAPSVAPVDPTQANAIENNYLNALANYDTSDAYSRQNYTEQEGLVGRNKTKSLGTLADSMADRGLTNSGIFLKTTGDVNTAALEQLNSAVRTRDLLLTQNQSGRVNAAKTRADALAEAQAQALRNAIQAWTDNYNAQLDIARQRNAAVAGG